MGNNETSHCSKTQIDWSQVEKSSPEEQIDFLSQWKGRFEVELVSSVGRNVKRGDHLAVERYKILASGKPLYTHHAICVAVGSDAVILSEYGGNLSGILDVPRLGFNSLGKIQHNEYKFHDLEDLMAYKVIWPKELKRYNDKRVTKRAKKRKDERLYHPFQNNCEHFASWCKCGLNVSIQARLWCLWARQIIDKVFNGGREIIENVVPVLLKVLAIVPNESVVAFASKPFAESMMNLLVKEGFINKAVISDIKEALDQWANDAQQFGNRVHERLVEIIRNTVCGFVNVSSVAGSVYQSLVSGFGYDSVDGSTDVVDGCPEKLFNEFIEWCQDTNEHNNNTNEPIQ